ncbi:DMT family transporter [Bradyrhizobium sp. U87765 SZCCT0131]|uniref:DMT family transporter n=1 Tax=unclassified Bradyrhizobium TaxID=2631580 RepID=UPI001BA562F0|nr:MULTISPECIES: DMT family transporter [unclassified Bradyrhizobium]MBR1220196.1 DMT family transporter [Bradyrhizobium sp. U87765 SZCCT0131]MBR1263348.1 DMT family transporter [Bradyrhizobium sp. U87765 SZCCT0134]MBR1306769.1 DMT family transporter [Bradyrhizobium sp. U87765 SZCCT0110]MBR1323268.1 DMT family transporter [Bradyrhizobium sp. U87765 SZCCT0109]MBR1345723.1 DMT family transporter [Bradyrhizobium sp. U87765 SZCCT0048]
MVSASQWNEDAVPGACANIVFALLVVGAGVSVALQQILNTNLRAELGSPWWAGFASYFTGTLTMLAAIVVSGQPWLSTAMAARTSWISWTGGIFGAIFIGTAILMVPRLGAATVLALIVVGQMIGSLAFDHFGLLGIPQQSATPVRLAGAVLLVFGVLLIRR